MILQKILMGKKGIMPVSHPCRVRGCVASLKKQEKRYLSLCQIDAGLRGFTVKRDVPEGEHRLIDVFIGFDKSPAAKRIFAEGKGCLEDIVVRIGSWPRYMRVMDDDGSISIGKSYLMSADTSHLYLDLVHEVTHVRQHRNGLPLYDERYRYIDRPTEIEAMKITVGEARRMGLSEREIAEYLKVYWVAEDEHVELLDKLGIRWHPPNSESIRITD